MKILYYNLQLGSFDGSNMHALGMLNALEKICGEENLYVANDFTQLKYNHISKKIKKKFSKLLNPIKILRRGLISRKNAKDILEKVSKENFRPNYIIARSVLYDTIPLILAKKLGCKLIIEHNTPFVYECCNLRKTGTEISIRKFENKILGNADGIYVVSDVLKEMLLLEYPDINKDKMIVIPNGYMKNLYSISNEEKIITRNRIREEMGVEDKWVVVFIGSLQSWHGIDRLLTVARNMRKKKDFEFWVMGDGEKRDLIEAYSKEHSNLKWFGNVSFERLRDLLISSDLGIMPYENIDNFYFSPLKMFDMIGAGLPFVGLRTGQIEKICQQDFNNDFLLETTSADEIISKINYIRNDKECYQSMKNLINGNSQKHTWNIRAKTLCDWMRKI